MSIFNYSDYKLFIREKILSFPHRGRGQYRQMASHLDVNSTVISQIFKGPRHLNPEQGLQVADYLGLSEIETKFFITLIHKERAGTHQLKNFYIKEEKKILNEAKTIKTRIIEHKEISDEHKAIFYSNWYYSGVRILSSIEEFQSVDQMALHLGLSRTLIQKVVSFLIETGLCIEQNGKIKIGPSHTHLDTQSPYINNHRRNWRLKGIEQISKPQENNLFYSAPIALSTKDYSLIQEELIAVIAKIIKRIEKSPEEKFACLNIDWFGI